MTAEHPKDYPPELETLLNGKLDAASLERELTRLNARAEVLLSIDPVSARKIAVVVRRYALERDMAEAAAFSRFIEGTAISSATEFEHAREVLEEASEEAEDAGEIELANRCRNGLAIIYERIGEYGKACEMLHHCLNLARVTSDSKGECRALSNLGTLHSNMGDYERAVSLLQECNDRGVAVSDPLLQITTRATLAEALVASGRYHEGLAIGERCQSDALDVNFRLQWGFITAIVAAALIGLGQFDRARETLRELETLASELGERDLLCDVLIKQIEVDLADGSKPPSKEALERALKLAEEVRIRQFEMRAHQLSAQAYARLNDFKAAFTHRSRELDLSNELKERNVARKVQVLAVEMSVDQHRRRADEEKQRNAELASLNEKLTETLARAEHYASHDSLTELLNRRKFLDLTEEAVQRALMSNEILGLAFVDLDGFKLINDTLGHDAGDALLIQVARRLKGAVRGCDLVSRAGGDEFMVLIRELATPEEIAAAVARIAAVFDEPFALHGAPTRSNGSVGYSIYPLHGDSVTALRIAADRAMYSEKRRRQAS
jgi:diguanylate cyclase (GGDEF)-like protein